ncbi:MULTISPECIES: 1-deoxy-D-xylulose-5-phosphate synthase [Capnocytophaga]|uniref:1-deoxy-D-xylulose-5-phosphate synthase n=1 Tax=Capnocytophaga TaxID=1016 RepID=UPI00020C5782|nr:MULTISPECIES: 1-deoxy-D-xylulose-5-phosphate synthase [unclassified Capnocytophaga]KHE68635.1 1-deoxy-D-xylulose-5-phosphate synthase [Capnocytophaga sp. oral taxon 329 str. F0087]QGS18501.1 1-deoxy-D-xylulose-5-phosphate synthase [Capnocytophaga sp. FDAARGOS_737]
MENLKHIPVEELPALAEQLRTRIIEVIAAHGGHLGASLGVVELTIALHYVFDTPDDILVWDVGHQCYAHKLLTGRSEAFAHIRQQGGISGFPKREESQYDAFGTGHSSTSLSAVLAMALASALEGNTQRQHIAVIGDAAIASGMAFEALNHAGTTDANMLIILNDNAMAIDPTVGALKDYFSSLRQGARETFFSDLHIKYKGTIDGHDLPALIEALKAEKNDCGVRLLHVVTTKGKGFAKAEAEQVRYHSPALFDKTTGEPLPEAPTLPAKYQEVVGQTLTELARSNPKIIAITPAMSSGSGLLSLQQAFPDRVFDVGIAEQHAVTFAAGWAARGFIPYCIVYSTFLQRAYDQLIHDVALQNLPVVFCIDRAGLVGEDGATHHGVFDMAFLRPIPNLIIASPRNATELRQLLYTAQLSLPHPIAIRYPRGRCSQTDWAQPFEALPIGKGCQLKEGTKVAVLSIGTIADLVAEQIRQSEVPEQYAHYDMRFLKPIDEALLHHVFTHYQKVVTIEEGSTGGLGSAVSEFAAANNYTTPLKIITLPDVFMPHGSVAALRKLAHLLID